MATITSKTSYKIDELINGSVISGQIVTGGHLQLTTRGGAVIDAGVVTKPFGGAWVDSASYEVGDVVGYAGTMWKALIASSNKPPALFTSYWSRLHGWDPQAWYNVDPFNTGDDPSQAWDLFWKSGAPTVTYSTIAAEVETSKQSLKVNTPLNTSQRFFQREENIVRGGEVIQVMMRAKLLGAVSSYRLNAELWQNDAAGKPDPFASGVSVVAAPEGSSREVPTSWTDLRFTMTAAAGKPRAKLHFIASPTASAGAVLVVDRIETRRYRNIFETDTDWINLTLLNGWVNFDSGTTSGGTGRAAQIRRFNGQVYLRGVIRSGTNLNTVGFVVPQYFRPAVTANAEFVLPAATGQGPGAGSLQINATTGEVLVGGSQAQTYIYLAGTPSWIAES